MSHLPPKISSHRHVGDPVVVQITLAVVGTVGTARFVAGALVKTLGAGIVQVGETTDGRAILQVVLTAADTTALGADLHPWQLEVGSPPFVAARGELQLDARM